MIKKFIDKLLGKSDTTAPKSKGGTRGVSGKRVEVTRDEHGIDPALVDVAARLFDFVQFLLDDDENLTPGGNLNGKARERLRERVGELIDGAEVEP